MSAPALHIDSQREALLAKAQERETSSELLRQIELALSRLARGRYGLCLKCDEMIERDHLDAVPWALFCTGCQHGVDTLHRAAQDLRRNATSSYWTEWQMEDAEQAVAVG